MKRLLLFVLLLFTYLFAYQPTTHALSLAPKANIGILDSSPAILDIVTIQLKKPEPPKPPEPIYIYPAKGKNAQGNWYVWGNCTWYVANNYAIPNNWGHARTWLERAKAQGFETSDKPKAGAIAWVQPGRSRYGHVAIVTKVHDDGTFTISEMNARGLGVINTRHITDVSRWQFIYTVAQ